MLGRPPRAQQPNPANTNSDFYYYMGVLEGGPLMRGLEQFYEKAPMTFKLGFLAFANLKLMEQEMEQAARLGQPINKRQFFKNAATAFTAAATTGLLAAALENSLGWWAAPVLMAGGKLLVDVAQGRGPEIREQFSTQTAQRYYNNLASWWNRQQPAAENTVAANNNNRQFRI